MDIVRLSSSTGSPQPDLGANNIDNFFAAYKAAVFTSVRGIADDKYVNDIIGIIGDSATDKLFVGSGPNGLSSIGCWRKQSWESEQLGVEVGRLSAWAVGEESGVGDEYHNMLKEMINDIEKSDVNLIHCRAPVSDYSLSHALQDQGFHIMDVVAYYRWEFPVPPRQMARPVSFEIRQSRESDLEPMKHMAAKSLTDTRFIKARYTTDKMIPATTAASLYGEWLSESIRGNFADHVVIAARDDVPIGFVACKIEEHSTVEGVEKFGVVTLNAVSEEERGQGVFSAILEEALRWFEPRVKAVTLCSQVTNTGVHKACIRLGANLDSSYITLHKWT